MGGEWNEITLGDFVTLQRGHDLPETNRIEGGVPVLGSFGITGWHNESRAKGPGVTVGRSGASFGVVSYSPVDYWPLNTALYVKNFHGNDPKFAFYFLKTLDFKRYNSGSAQPSLNRNHIHPIPIAIPELQEQKSIAHILGTLDDKIELNRQMNATLEAMAQALFKSWFVDFDPVIDNALAAGNPIPEPLHARAEIRKALGGKRKPLPEEIQKQFPSRFVFSEEMGWIPEGWQPTPLDHIANYQNGLALQKFRPENEDDFLPVVKIAQLKKGYADGEEKASPNIKPECIIDDGDVVFSWSGSLMVDVWCGGKGALNQHLFKVTSNKYPKWFFYEYTKHHLIEFQRIAADKAVTMGHIKREHLRQANCLVPLPGMLEQCSLLVESLLEQHVDLRKQNKQLGTLRDTLLPKLLSGELRISDAEKLVAGAA